MEELRAQVESLSELWSKTFKTVLTEQSAASFLQDITLVQLDEAVRTLAAQLSQARTPKRLAPMFDLGKALASTGVSQALGSLKQISAGEPRFLPQFVTSINQSLTAFHTILAYSDKKDGNDLTHQQLEAITLLNTAHKELHEKKVESESAIELFEEAKSAKAKASTTLDSLAKFSAEAADFKGEAEEALSDIKTYDATIKVKLQEVDALQTATAESKKKMEADHTELKALLKEAKRHEETVRELLPKAATAGLAHGFHSRVEQLQSTKWMWACFFILSVLLLAGFSGYLVSLKLTTTEELWKQVLHRLPLAAPFVWLGYFSAVQYGNVIRVQEDYAFKEATSKAFAGYRDHMKYLAEISDEDGISAMQALAAKTIDILGSEPLRIYKPTHRDVSPSHELIEVLKAQAEIAKEWHKAKVAEKAPEKSGK